MMGRMHLQLNASEVKALLLMVHAASEITWTNKETREAMRLLSDRIQTAVAVQLPYLKTFLEDKGALVATF